MRINIKPIKCNDGTWTFKNLDLMETYHSITGSRTEAMEKFVKPINFKKKIKEKKALTKEPRIRILDVCFGLGYNTAAAIEFIRSIDKKIIIEVTALELHKEIIIKSLELEFPFNNKKIFEELIRNYDSEKKEFNFSNNKTRIKVIIGDARRKIKELRKQEKFDAVFFDAFSPKKNPHMWSTNFFKNIKELCNKECVLTTYSCARRIRNNLVKAGFTIKDGPAVGRRGPSTIAIV